MKNEMTYLLYAGWLADNPVIGELAVQNLRGKEMMAISFHSDWLSAHGQLFLDPELFPFDGRQFSGKKCFGMLADVAPDRWGRTLLKRREHKLAKQGNRSEKTLQETDFILGTSDFLRTGGLRISRDGVFLQDNTAKIPPMTSLRKLQQTSLGLESNDDFLNIMDLQSLVYPGSSLGGARPKCNVTDPKNELWIAKLSSLKDEWHTENWEMVVHDLAAMCGLTVPPAMLKKVDKRYIYLIKRFDRAGERRIHFASAMTMLNKQDGDTGSFLEMAEFISREGKEPETDLRELWKRIVFSVAVSNTDCHLRNHGFILQGNGWRLAPAYDMNPNPYGKNLALAVRGEDTTCDYDTVIRSASYYTVKDAKEEVQRIVETVQNNYANLAEKYEIPESEVGFMKSAFRI